MIDINLEIYFITGLVNLMHYILLFFIFNFSKSWFSSYTILFLNF